MGYVTKGLYPASTRKSAHLPLVSAEGVGPNVGEGSEGVSGRGVEAEGHDHLVVAPHTCRVGATRGGAGGGVQG